MRAAPTVLLVAVLRRERRCLRMLSGLNHKRCVLQTRRETRAQAAQLVRLEPSAAGPGTQLILASGPCKSSGSHLDLDVMRSSLAKLSYCPTLPQSWRPKSVSRTKQTGPSQARSLQSPKRTVRFHASTPDDIRGRLGFRIHFCDVMNPKRRRLRFGYLCGDSTAEDQIRTPVRRASCDTPFCERSCLEWDKMVLTRNDAENP